MTNTINRRWRVAWITAVLAVIMGLFCWFIYPKLFNCSHGYWHQWGWLMVVDGLPILLLVGFSLVSGIFSFIGALRKPWSWASLLLVFWFIVFILVLLVLNTFSSARMKAPEAATMSALASLRSQAELLKAQVGPNYSINTDSCYTPGSIFTRPEMKPLIDMVESRNFFKARCFSTVNTWAVSIAFSPFSKPGLFCNQPGDLGFSEVEATNFCSDSTGFAGRITKPITGPSCNTTN